jgi:hypothetical protein
MARSFNGLNQALQSASALAALAGLQRAAIGCWIKSDFLGDDDILWETSANSNAVDGTFRIVISASGSDLYPMASVNGSPANAGNTTVRSTINPSSDTWHYLLVNYCLTNNGSGALYEVESIWIDGLNRTGPNLAAPDNTGSLTSQVLNLMSRNGSALWADGELADVTIWGGSDPIGSSENADLYAGRRGKTVRPDDVLYNWKLVGDNSPEPASVGDIPLNLVGTPSKTDDPPTLDSPAEVLPQLAFTLGRLSDSVAIIEWDDTDPSITDGVIIARAPGDQVGVSDENDFPPGHPAFNPLSIPGAVLVSNNVMTSPYEDDTGAAGDYTWWINRADPMVV